LPCSNQLATKSLLLQQNPGKLVSSPISTCSTNGKMLDMAGGER
jgi:hypothetical protein